MFSKLAALAALAGIAAPVTVRKGQAQMPRNGNVARSFTKNGPGRRHQQGTDERRKAFAKEGFLYGVSGAKLAKKALNRQIVTSKPN